MIHVYHGDGADVRALIGKKDPKRRVVVWSSEDAFRAGIAEAEILFTSSPPPAHDWSSARKLRLIQMMGVGVDDLLPAQALRPEVVVTGLRGIFAAEVAEHVFALLLALVRSMKAMVMRQERREWRPFASDMLSGKTIGILGYGEVGRRVARIAEAFEMKVAVFSRSRGDLGEVVEAADVLVVCLPRTPHTVGLLDRSFIERLRPRAIVVNVARGGIVDEAALLDAILRGDVGGVAFDVFEEEPLPKTSAWWTVPNAIVTPHIAGHGLHYEERAVDVLLGNVRRLEAGEALLHVVDRTSGY